MKEKISLRETISNVCYATDLCMSISKSIVIHSFFLWLTGYFEWVFFDGIFMRKIVDALDRDLGFQYIFTFIIGSGIFFGLCSIYNNYVENVVYPLETNRLFGGIYKKLYAKARNVELKCYEDADFYNRYTMAMDGAKEIRLSNVFALMKKQYREATIRNVKIAVKYAFANCSLSFWRITFTFTAIFEGVLLYAIYRNLVTGSISLAELTIMTSLMVAMTWILIRVFENVMEIMKNGMFVHNLRSFLEYEEVIPEDQEGIEPSRDFESLEFRDVCFSYKEEQTIKNLSFKIEKGEIAALVGHNGAGKTTIIKLLLRLYDPNSGCIYYNGRDIREYNLKAYREIFAATFQDFQMFGMTIKENVLLGRHYHNEDELVVDALKKAGVYDKVMTLKDGINTMMTKEFDEDGAVLSGGETQKIAVARTFVKEAPMKIFDEPSSALDPIAEYELFDNIMKEGSNHTMLFISHRLSSVKNCDKVFMLEKGRLIEEGTHQELIKANAAYAQMYKKQAMNYLALEKEEEVIL